MLQKMSAEEMYIERLSYERTSGYWKVAGKSFFDKIECLQYASKIKNYKITYHIFEQAYSALDWNSDKQYNLDELYKRRAQQIRDKYDYVMVAFSGGADSRNVLRSFIDNNIHIDEIVSYYPIKASDKLKTEFDGTDKSASNAIFEYYLAAHPTLLEIAAMRPDTKITVIDYTDYVLDVIAKDKPEELIKYGSTLSVYNGGERILSNMLKGYSEKYNNACCVYGIDKPNLRYDTVNKRLGVCIHDFSHNKCKFVIDGYRPIIEPFYQTPDMPEIFLAQAKTIKKYLLPLLTADTMLPSTEALLKDTPFPGVKIVDHNGRAVTNSILYKHYNPAIYQTEKPNSQFFGQEPESWFHKRDLVDTTTNGTFKGQHTDWLYGVDDALIIRDDKGIPLRFKQYASKLYWC